MWVSVRLCFCLSFVVGRFVVWVCLSLWSLCVDLSAVFVVVLLMVCLVVLSWLFVIASCAVPPFLPPLSAPAVGLVVFGVVVGAVSVVAAADGAAGPVAVGPLSPRCHRCGVWGPLGPGGLLWSFCTLLFRPAELRRSSAPALNASYLSSLSWPDPVAGQAEALLSSAFDLLSSDLRFSQVDSLEGEQ